jgi:hypothetical protein
MRILLLAVVSALSAGCALPAPPKPSPCRYAAGYRLLPHSSVSHPQEAREKEGGPGQ